MNSIEFIKKAQNQEIDVIENIKNTLKVCKEINSEYNYFINLNEEYTLKEAEKLVNETKKLTKEEIKNKKLFGLPVSIKDCICVKDLESRSGSKVLKNYKPFFDATIVDKIKEQGGIILGKTSQDAFGFGSFNVNVGIDEKIPLNPYDKERVTGGSSGGAAGITRKLFEKKINHIAIAESTGGSIACPAAYSGVYGLTPTYGLVSRYGLMDYGNSLDKIGIMANDIEEIALMLEVISGFDEKDSTSKNIEIPKYSEKTDLKKLNFKVAVLKEFVENINEDVKKNLFETLEKAKKNYKLIYEFVSLPLTFKYGIQTYYLIAISEASTNLAKFSGIRYGYEKELKGNFNEYFSEVRTEAFSKEEKRRIILGTFARMSGFRDAYYLKALKVRTKIIQEYKKLFENYDLLISPTMPNVAPKFSEIKTLTPLENYMMDIMTVGPNLAGLPHLSLPNGFSKNMPTALMIIANHFEEKKIIDFARLLNY
ncbi:MAG: amidase family protein [Candidatus Woesearchaeota archaeon]